MTIRSLIGTGAFNWIIVFFNSCVKMKMASISKCI